MTQDVAEIARQDGTSSFVNCHFVARGNDTVISDSKDHPALFWFDATHRAQVTLHGYLLVPIEVFTSRQVKSALKKWRAGLLQQGGEHE